MPNTSRTVNGVYAYYEAHAGGTGHLNLNGYIGKTYFAVSGGSIWSAPISLNNFYGTSPTNEWGGGGK